MGVNCNIYLPVDVDDRRLADACVVMAGAPHREGVLQSGSPHVDHDLHSQACGSIPGMVDIVLGNEVPRFEGIYRSAYFHYCSRDINGDGQVYNLLSPVSNPLWCALGRRLVQWFGGFVHFNDCRNRSNGNLYRPRGVRACPVNRHGLVPDDGPEWSEYHRALLALEPISEAELDRAAMVAANPRQRPEGISV